MSYEVKKWAYKPMVITSENAISEGRYLSRIEFRKTDKAKWLLLEVRDKEGGVARKSYFEPKLGSGFIKTDADFVKEQGKFSSVLQSLVRAMLSDGYETGKIESFDEFCLKVQKDIPEALFNKELRVKCIYDKSGNPTLPTFGVVFEDPIRIPKDKSRMKITERDVVAKIEVDPETIPNTSPVNKDDLPF